MLTVWLNSSNTYNNGFQTSKAIFVNSDNEVLGSSLALATDEGMPSCTIEPGRGGNGGT